MPDEPVWPAPSGAVSIPEAGSPLLVTDAPYAAKCDAKLVSDAALTSGSNALSSVQGSFNSLPTPQSPTGDVGKVVLVNDGTSNTAPLVGWITSVNAGVATLMTTKGGSTPANAGQTVAGRYAFYGTDDTAAYRLLFTDLWGGVGAYGLIPGLSMIAGALQTASPGPYGASCTYNSQIPLPALDPTFQQRRRIKLVGTSTLGSGAEPHGGTADRTTVGWCGLVSTITGMAANIAAPPSMLGGPTNTTTNIALELEDLAFISPENPTIGLVHAQFVANALVRRCLFTSSILAGSANAPTPSNVNGFGYWPPGQGDYEPNELMNCTFSQMYAGFGLGEHFSFDQVSTFGLQVGMFAQQALTFGVRGGYAHLWGTKYGLATLTNAGAVTVAGNLPIDLPLVELESTATFVVWDASNNVVGRIGYNNANPGYFSGCQKVELSNFQQARGVITPPAVPATGVAFALIDRPSVYTFTGGTVSSITINGTATGLTTGAIFVPSHRLLAVNYTVVPTLSSLIVL